ncbi:hypothetical protein RFI_29557, partial [Reticulomyxa filosa]
KNRVCKVANEFTKELMQACRYEKNCPLSQVYGAILGGCLQNRLAIRHKHNSAIIFLFQLDKNSKHDRYYAENTQMQILDWIRRYFEIGRLHSERSLWIKYDKCEFNILVAFTYERQKYCQFNLKENKQHLRLFNSEEVEKIAHDLMSSYNQYKNAIQDVQIQDHIYIDFLNQNMSTVFSILRTYYIRDDHIGTETRLAILLLKAWKYYLLRRKICYDFIEDVSIEMLCVYAKDLIVKDQQRQQEEEKKMMMSKKRKNKKLLYLILFNKSFLCWFTLVNM